MIDNFYKKLRTIFSLDKLKIDLFNYLEIDSTKHFQINLDSSNEFNEKVKSFVFDSNDSIVVESIITREKYYNQLYIPYQVNLIIGNFKPEFGIISFEKMLVEMSYDKDYDLITVDISHNSD